MITIHCIAMDPAEGGVGGVDWRRRYEAGQQHFDALCADPAYDDSTISYFEMHVPEWATNTEITDHASEKAWALDYMPIRRRPAKEVA